MNDRMNSMFVPLRACVCVFVCELICVFIIRIIVKSIFPMGECEN